jgi:hypothetical protein
MPRLDSSTTAAAGVEGAVAAMASGVREVAATPWSTTVGLNRSRVVLDRRWGAGAAWPTVTPEFKGESECIEHMCVRIKFHTCVDLVYTKTQCKSVKRVLKLYYMTECLKIEHKRVLATVKDVSTGS